MNRSSGYLLIIFVMMMSCARNEVATVNKPTSYIEVTLLEGRSVDILIRDLVTIKSVPTGLRKVKLLDKADNTWLLQFDPEHINPDTLLKAIQDYPNTLRATFADRAKPE